MNRVRYARLIGQRNLSRLAWREAGREAGNRNRELGRLIGRIGGISDDLEGIVPKRQRSNAGICQRERIGMADSACRAGIEDQHRSTGGNGVKKLTAFESFDNDARRAANPLGNRLLIHWCLFRSCCDKFTHARESVLNYTPGLADESPAEIRPLQAFLAIGSR